MAVKTSPPGWGPAPSPARAVTTTTRPATSTNVLIRRMLELPEADGPRDRLEVVLGVAEVERRGLDPLVDQVQRVFLAIADRAEDLMATPRDCQAGVGGGDLHVVEDHFEHLLAADRSELNSTDAAPLARQQHQAQALALAHDDGENVGDVSVLDEELAAGQAARHAAGERNVVGIARSVFFRQRQRGDELTARQGGKQTFLLICVGRGRQQRRDDDGARDERAGQAGGAAQTADRDHGAPALSGAHSPSRSIPSRAIFCPVSSARTLASAVSYVIGAPSRSRQATR